MTTLTKRVGVVRRAWEAPESEAGRARFASLLNVEDASQVERFRLALDGNEVREAHSHDADMAIGVTRGCLVLSLGATLHERLDVRAGDYVLVPGGVVHREAALEEGVEMIVAHLEPAGTTPAG
jgi:quercetin dioxygenase-like cupin family protein